MTGFVKSDKSNLLFNRTATLKHYSNVHIYPGTVIIIIASYIHYRHSRQPGLLLTAVLLTYKTMTEPVSSVTSVKLLN